MTPTGPVYRIARPPTPWRPIDWAYAGADNTFGNRWDDPEGTYRVLYASSQRLGCFLETLARFRVDLKLIAELNEIEGEDDYTLLGAVPRGWCESRVMGVARTYGSYADIYAAEWIALLRRELAAECVQLGVTDLDASVLQRTLPRRLTQLASRIVYDAGLDGVSYRSKYGHDMENWALFEPFLVLPEPSVEIAEEDPDLLKAMEIHALRWA